MKIILFAFLLSFSLSLAAKPVGKDTSIVVLNGPWKFHIGDNQKWASTGFNDSNWESVSLKAKTGAHDDDVGLSGYVPGWAMKGHTSYYGYAWYRITIPSVFLSAGNKILTGPTDVDDVYQVFLNGQLLGGIGDFSRSTPIIYSIQPRLYKIPQSLLKDSSKQIVLAFRVWLSPFTLSQAPDAGGIHIAPVLGNTKTIQSVYQKQWSQTFWGYVVDAFEPLLFVALAFLAGICIRHGAEPTSYKWLIAALLLTALVRASQVFFYWGQWESLKVYMLTREVLLIPLSIAAWIITWQNWFSLSATRWVSKLTIVLSLLYILGQFLSFNWQYETVHPYLYLFNLIGSSLRLLLLVMLLIVVFAGVKSSGVKSLLPVCIIILLMCSLFAQELSAIHVPGIWFPFGVGVSRTQFAYAAFGVLLFFLLITRLRRLKKVN